MNKIAHIYGNGCSFTYDDYIKRTLGKPDYLDLLAQRYGTTVTNAAMPGSCNRRIVRNTLRAATGFNSSTLVLVQLTFLSRTEKPYNPGQNNEWKMDASRSVQEYHESIKHNADEQLNKRYFDTWFRFFNEAAEVTNLATDLIMLSSYLKSRSIPYLIFPYFPLVEDKTREKVNGDILQTVLSQDANILNILSDSLISRMKHVEYYDADSSNRVGHLSPQGHELAAELLSSLLDAQV